MLLGTLSDPLAIDKVVSIIMHRLKAERGTNSHSRINGSINTKLDENVAKIHAKSKRIF